MLIAMRDLRLRLYCILYRVRLKFFQLVFWKIDDFIYSFWLNLIFSSRDIKFPAQALWIFLSQSSELIETQIILEKFSTFLAIFHLMATLHVNK